ncbi:hypothetical protein O6H91_07G001600 [Diphasiastrum complanatum]|uniref:Uncharacterized protein n=1 Tax=Diphasiastrum complanatum TaxID=34168 RepID=A0ACC2D1T1_DIPCM|nr:hypothetical protein O6H91_07G001600 [Diphasiastrum complanatum]
MTNSIVWFRRDLRVEDNSALLSASRAEGAVVPVFLWCPEEEARFYPGRGSRWWLKQSLVELDLALKSLGGQLIFRIAVDSLCELLDIAKATGATRVFFNHLYDPMSLLKDHRVKQGLVQNGIAVTTFNGDLLYEPWEVMNKEGIAFTTFETFWLKFLSMPADPDSPTLPPRRLNPPLCKVSSCSIEELGLEDESDRNSNALLARSWKPGWSRADRALDEFVCGPLSEYEANRKKADRANTSLLSPYMHFGELSVRKVFHSAREKQAMWAQAGDAAAARSVNSFLRSLGLREYSRYMCFHFPYTHEKPLLPNLKSFPWRLDEGYFSAWRQGRTGYPLVDAGMRELWATGWLHNSIRVVVASFCVKALQLPWQWGMKYFWDSLLDADFECDVLGWQYISGGLPDGHELDRLDNPQVEGCKLDPQGEYVRKWLPELSRLPSEWIHHPWDAPPSVLRAAGIELGCNYPRPIVELVAAKDRLQRAIAQMLEKEAASKPNSMADRPGEGSSSNT